jgi:hypothetical protein
MRQAVCEASLGENLLVLAGPKGAGKSTLLTNALRDKAPLFGPEVDTEFQATLPPGVGKEFRLRTSEVIGRRTWASNPHLTGLAALEHPLVSLVAHVDIMDFCQFTARDYSSLLNRDENLSCMMRGAQAAIFPRYRRVHVATLDTPYQRCAVWFNERAVRWGKPPSPNDVRLYSGSAEGVAVFDAVRAAWLAFVGALPNLATHRRIAYDGETVVVAPA